MKILYIEDDAGISSLAKAIFMRTNHDLVICPIPSIAKTILNIEKIDLIILDIVFPKNENGIDLLKHIEEKHINVPVFIYSGYSEEYTTSIQHFVELGIVKEIYGKPTDTFSEIIKKIDLMDPR